MGGNGRVRGPKSARFFIPHGARRRPFRCARKQQHDAQEQTPDNHPNGSKTELTSDHLVILPGASCGVDSSPGSILPVPAGSHFASASGTNVLPLDSAQNHAPRLESPFLSALLAVKIFKLLPIELLDRPGGHLQRPNCEANPYRPLGTDTTGRVFSENTTTVVLSRHGAGIVSRNRRDPDESLTISFPRRQRRGSCPPGR